MKLQVSEVESITTLDHQNVRKIAIFLTQDHTDKARIRQSRWRSSDRSQPPSLPSDVPRRDNTRNFLISALFVPRDGHTHHTPPPPPQPTKAEEDKQSSHGFVGGRRGERVPRDPAGGPGAAERAHRGAVRLRKEEGPAEEEEGPEHGPAAVVPRRAGARVPRRHAGRRLRVRPLRPREAGGVPAVRCGLPGPEPGAEPGGRDHRHPVRGRRRQVHPVPALRRGVRPPEVPRVRAHPRPLGHARHPRRPHRRVAHRRHLAGRRQGGAGGRVVVPGAAAALHHHHADLDRGAGDRVHRVPAQRGAGPGEEAVPRRLLLRPAGTGGGPGEEGAAAAGGDQARPPRHGRLPRLRRAGRRHRQGAAQQLGHPPQRPAAHHHLRHLRLLLKCSVGRRRAMYMFLSAQLQNGRMRVRVRTCFGFVCRVMDERVSQFAKILC